ncbi:hypothetical protein HQ325_15225 [Rhodococcus sp. BP-349]|uniref:hypothetical protein n=1 Tax=unclassified Rhodococcus (in: high G+C Gram-positive bacteria) TaxID=192944 RepID=UPI001C9A9D5D|nr:MULTISPECIES: hypothetical protein [unclassified Rhodococcus (in: high G+C Gram-positive bacteria)]MBY6540028.1 hypothetical protein [Rhodococcus sp. BP-363]MBY6543644.1 hypothetical protein [Rhodococcus sp. BP-369]MBY6562874.1 hypothetical protein [Rhodococcus sp. BP-370]MBY6577166.1 hypothetical protein [Rhodococcus sp. BP-364]MBY6586467.1 hypothetical protein [Rhodococcus sp. BP-358]
MAAINPRDDKDKDTVQAKKIPVAIELAHAVSAPLTGATFAPTDTARAVAIIPATALRERRGRTTVAAIPAERAVTSMALMTVANAVGEAEGSIRESKGE